MRERDWSVTQPPARQHQISKATLYTFGSLGGILFGYDLGVISGVLLYIKKIWTLGSFAQGVVGASFAFGAIFGAVFAGRLTDRLGRKRTIMTAGLVFALATLGCTLSPNVAAFVVFRFIAGIAVGASSTTVPMYLAELAPTRLRGGLAALNQLMIVGGVLIAYIIDWALSGSGDWRLMIALAIVPGVALALGMIRMPETPRWLVKAGREDEARPVILAAQGAGADVDGEIAGIHEVLRLDSEQKGRLRDLGKAWARPALLVALILAVGQQFSGVNAINVYAPTMFTNLGLGDSASLLASVVLGAAKVLLTIWVIFIVDRWGRRPLLLIGAGFMAVALLALGIAGEMLHSAGAAGITTLIFLIAYLAGYELGWGAVVWIMISEVFPLKVRGVGMGTASTALWTATFAITLVFPVMDDGLGLSVSAWVFAAVNVVLCLLVAKFVPETKGRSLEEIELDTRQRIRVGRTPATALKEG